MSYFIIFSYKFFKIFPIECISYTVAVSSDHVTEIDFVLVVPSLNFEFHNYGQNVCHTPCERNEFFVLLGLANLLISV